MIFHDKLNKLLKPIRYELAPDEDINNLLSQHNSYGGDFNPNNSIDLVLADKLGDYGDPREQIVRQDLQHRGKFISDFTNNLDNYIEQNFKTYATGSGHRFRTYPLKTGELEVDIQHNQIIMR